MWLLGAHRTPTHPLEPAALRRTQAQGLKRKLEAATSVSEKRMKLLGLKAKAGGRPAVDADTMAELALKPGAKLIMMG